MTPLDRLEWLQAIAGDRSIPHPSLRVAVALCGYLGREGDSVYPGIDNLAADCALHRATVVRMLEALRRAGHIEKRKGGGRGRATEWTLKTVADRATVSDPSNSRALATVKPDKLSQETVAETVAGSAETVAETVATLRHQQGLEHGKDKTPLPPMPEWLDPQPWAAWEIHRREIRKKLTDSTRAAQWRKLDKLRAEGHDPGAVIEHSIAGGWTGLFPPDPPKGRINGNGHSPGRRLTSGERIEKLIRDADAGLADENGGGGDGAPVAPDGRHLRDG